MSTYEDYGRASLDYDTTRVAVGTEIVLGSMVVHGVTPADAHVLDAGCGTGSYAAAIAPLVRSMTLVDANEGMLAQAEAKLAGMAGVAVVDHADPGPDGDLAERAGLAIHVHQARLPDLPVADASIDVVMVNQVLHHLGDEEGAVGGEDEGDRWPGHRAAIAELARTLRPGGVLVVNTCSQSQLRDAYWYYELIPEGADALRRRYAPLEALEAAMAAAGLQPTGRFVPTAHVLQGPSYFNGAAPLEPSWRNGDSAWSLTSDAELDAALRRVRTLAESGDLDAFVAEHDRRRPDLGQLTFVTARKPERAG